MPLTFTFALSQQQSFELRCHYGSRRFDKVELAALIDLCERRYYPQERDSLHDLTELGRRIYQWLDGKEGWLRKSLSEADEQTIYLDSPQLWRSPQPPFLRGAIFQQLWRSPQPPLKRGAIFQLQPP